MKSIQQRQDKTISYEFQTRNLSDQFKQLFISAGVKRP